MTQNIVSSSTPPETAAVAARGLGKRYGHVWAVAPLDLTIAPGERVAVFGPNGAGKTTLIRLLATALRPTSGQLLVAGADAAAEPALVRRQLGVVSHLTHLYPDLTAAENLRFFGRMYGVRDLKARIDEALERVGLAGRAHHPVRALSRGLQQRLALARATLHGPSLLLLDEPDTGLDAETSARLPVILGLDRTDSFTGSQPSAVVMATHNHALGRALCDRILHLQGGRLLA